MKQLNCHECSELFDVSYAGWKKKRHMFNKYGYKHYCSKPCRVKGQNHQGVKMVVCKNCNVEFKKQQREIKKNKNDFCGSSCNAIYQNANKTKGTRRSKLEVYLESRLTEIYPNLEILYSDKTTIKSELDFYIPSLNLAFELNGIFHYEPIYGKDKLNQIQNNDGRKFQACLEQGIELCIIDSSGQKYFKESTSQKYLDIIIKLINQKLVP